MITLEQIRALDTKVQQAVEVIGTLRKENTDLKERLSGYEKKVEELEVLIETFKNDQGEIEEGIQKALERLDYISRTGQGKENPSNPAKGEDIAEMEAVDIEDDFSDDALEEREEENRTTELDIF